MNFNFEQRSAVRHFMGPCMVLAGPGSGKTTVIVNRIRYLTGECGIPPEKILVITFTRAAAEEMKERYRVLAGGEQGISFGTFHALFFKIIRYAYHYDFSNILNEEERIRFIKDAAEKAGIENISDTDIVYELSNEISCLKNSGGHVETYKPFATDRKTFRIIYDEFERILRSEIKIDFDDMLLQSDRLFDEKPEVLKYWQNVYDHILIDEFQDICPLQYRLIKRIAALHNNIFVVGDDDQSIYSFRGADPEMLVSFEKDYRKCDGYEKICLGINYRCSKEIVEAAKMLISHNKKRFKKNLKSGRISVPRISTVLFREFENLGNETEYIAEMVGELLKRGVDHSEIAVLYRVNTQPGPLITRLKEKNIRFCLRDAVPNIYEHWIVKNIFAYIELAEMEKEKNPDKKHMRELFLSIANRPVRYISREIMRKADLSLDAVRRECADKAYVREKIDKLKYDLNMISKLNMPAAVKYIRKAVGYDDFLTKYAKDRMLDVDGLFDILNEIEEASKEFESFASWKTHIKEYSEALKLKKKNQSEKENGISLLTFHAAKGMEFDTVFIIDASEDYTPYWQAEDSAAIEEERRMFYVAVTRAKNRLFILHAKDRLGRVREKSRFIKELKKL